MQRLSLHSAAAGVERRTRRERLQFDSQAGSLIAAKRHAAGGTCQT